MMNEEEDPHSLQFIEIEGERKIEDKTMNKSTSDYRQPMEKKKHKISTQQKPKMDIVGDYWDKEKVSQVVDLLMEYKYIFPSTFSKIKGILGDLGEMKIQLKLSATPLKKIPYKLNPKYKEKLQQELGKMLTLGIIVSMEESEWISPMVIQDKKIVWIWIYVDQSNLNDVRFHDPFPTPFTYEILEKVEGKEVY